MAYQKLQAYRAAAVVPSNTVNIPSISAQDGKGNNGCVFIPVQVLKVFSTGTTATNIVALW